MLKRLVCLALFTAATGIAPAQTPKFNPTDIGSLLGTNSVAQAINNPGHVVGYWVRDIGTAAFLYRSNQVFEITALGTNANFALSINDEGQVVGHSWLTNEFRAFHFDGTNVVGLGDWGGTNTYATGINASNRISGFAETTNGVLGIYFDGQPYDIGSLGGNTYAYGLNATGVIVGASITNGELHAFRHDSSGIQDLNALFPEGGITLTAARAVNASGNIAGWGITNGITQPFLITDTNLTLIPLLTDSTNGFAYAINASDSVVGTGETTNGNRAFLWREGNLLDLNDCIATNSGWILREATGINDNGQIVGWGHVNGEIHAFLLTPNQAPAVTITSPTNSASFVSPVDLTITATATDDVEVSKVDFYADGHLIGSRTATPYTVTWPDVCAGSYAFTAVAYDNLGIAATSAVVTVNVALPEGAYLKCWLKPESLNLTNGAPVMTWPDSSGLGNNATASSSGSAPIFLTNVNNGWPAVKFDGTNDLLSMPGFMHQANAGEAFIVIKAGTKTTDPFWQICSSAGSSYNSTAIQDSFGCASAYHYMGPNANASRFALYNASAGGNAWNGRVNGILQWTASTSNYFTTAYCYLGARLSSYGSPTVSEFLVFRKILTDAQRNSVNKHLMRKYRFEAALPAPVTSLAANAVGTNRILLTWAYPITNQWVGFKIERMTNGVYAEIARVENTVSWFDTSVVNGGSYTYRIKPFTVAGEADYSNEATAIVPTTGVAAPFGSLRYWLSADYGYPANGANYWLDRTGGANNWVFNTTLIQNIANGLPAVRFNGSNAYVQLAASSSLNPAEMFIVLKAQSATPTKTSGLLKWGTDTFYPQKASSVLWYIVDGFNSTSATTLGSPPINIATTHIYNSSASTTKNTYFNGIPFGAYTSPLPTIVSGTYLGRTIVAGFTYFDGYIMEFLVFNRTLTRDERFVIGKYLSDKYSIVTNAPGIPNIHCRAVNQQQIEVSWNATATTSYLVERKSGDDLFTPLATLDPRTNKFVDTFQSSDPLTYRVSAQNYFTNSSAEMLTPLAVISNPGANQAQFVGQTIGISVQPNNSPTNYAMIYTNWAFNTPGNGYIIVSNANNLVFSGRTPFTIECRIKPTIIPTNWVGVVSRYNAAVGGNWMLDLDPGGIPFLFREATPWNKARATSGLPTNVWTHLAGSYDGTNMTLYVNGVVAGTAINTNNSQGSTVSLLLGAGQSSSVTTRYFNGQIDEVRFWSKALSASNIVTWKDSVLNSAHPDYNSLLRYVPLDGPTNNIIVTNGTFVPVSGYNPFRVDLFADATLHQRWHDAPYDTTFLSAVPRRWSFITLAYDGFNNSRYSAPLNVDFIYPSATDLANLPDSDGDGLPDYIEDFITTNPNDQDTDGDGMPDWWEIWYGLNPRRDIGRDGASGDFDNDGFTNSQEYANGTNPADGLNGGTSSTQLDIHRPN